MIITVVVIVTQLSGKERAKGNTTKAFLVLELKANVLKVAVSNANSFPDRYPIKGAIIINMI